MTFMSFYFYRRLVLAFFIIYSSSHPDFQVLSQLGMSFAMIVLLLIIKPYEDKWYFWLEVINEFNLLIVCYLFVAINLTGDNYELQ